MTLEPGLKPGRGATTFRHLCRRCRALHATARTEGRFEPALRRSVFDRRPAAPGAILPSVTRTWVSSYENVRGSPTVRWTTFAVPNVALRAFTAALSSAGVGTTTVAA